MRVLGSPMRMLGSPMRILGSPMKILGFPMRILESPMKRQAGSPMKWGLQWISDDDDFFPDSFSDGVMIRNSFKNENFHMNGNYLHYHNHRNLADAFICADFIVWLTAWTPSKYDATHNLDVRLLLWGIITNSIHNLLMLWSPPTAVHYMDAWAKDFSIQQIVRLICNLLVLCDGQTGIWNVHYVDIYVSIHGRFGFYLSIHIYLSIYISIQGHRIQVWELDSWRSLCTVFVLCLWRHTVSPSIITT